MAADLLKARTALEELVETNNAVIDFVIPFLAVASATGAMANDEWEEWQELLTKNGFATSKAQEVIGKE